MRNYKKKKAKNDDNVLYLVDTPPSPDVFGSQWPMLLEVLHHELMILRNNHDYYQEEADKIKQSPERKNAMQAFATFYAEQLAHVQKCLLNLSAY